MDLDLEGNSLLDQHRARYEDEDGVPVRESLATLINQIWEKGQDGEVKRLTKYTRLSNVMIHKVDLNEEAYGQFPKLLVVGI